MWLVVILAVAGFFIMGDLTHWDDTMMLCLIGIAFGLWFNFRGHKILGWGLLVLCGGALALYLLFG